MAGEIVIFGSGVIGRKCFHYIGERNVAFFCDNNAALAGGQCCGVPVISYQELIELKKTDQDMIILICARDSYAEQMIDQLMGDGIVDAVVMNDEAVFAAEFRISENARRTLECRENRIASAYQWVYTRLKREKKIVEYLKRHIEPSAMKPATGQLRRVQLENVSFTRETLDFLAENCPVRCWVDYGILLGKLRHNGYIPWDDDVDLGIMRADLKKLIEFFEQYSTVYVPDALYADRGAGGATAWEDTMQIARKYEGKYILQRQPHMCRIIKLDKYGGEGLELWVYDYVRSGVSIKQVNGAVRECLALKTAEITMTDLLARQEQLIRDSGYFSLSETEKIMPGIDNGLFDRIKRTYDIVDIEDIFPLVDCEFEGVMLPFPNNKKRVLELSYMEWESLPDDIGVNHVGDLD